DRVIPQYLDASDRNWLEAADRLLELFRTQQGRTRGCVEEDLRELLGNDPAQLVHRGLAKLLEDRCEFEVIPGHPPEKIRDEVFRIAAARRVRGCESQRLGAEAEPCAPSLSHSPTLSLSHPLTSFNRRAVLREAADPIGLTAD